MLGYHLSSEEHGPRELVGFASRAEQVGFEFAQISDHFHPWVERQGQSPFVWGVLGAIAHATQHMDVGTAVTCPTTRIHPAIVAQAAATAACQFGGRFFLGVGTGERLNEHVLGDHWPPASVRLDMLEESIEVIRDLWQGDMVTRRGDFYTVENAQLFTLPADPAMLPSIVMSALGERSVGLAARIGDGVMMTAPKGPALASYRSQGGTGTSYSMTHVCVASSMEDALRTARAWWPNSAIPGLAGVELAIPEHFEALGDAVSDETFVDAFVLGNDVDEHLEEIHRHFDAGFERVAIHQIGPDQDAFFRFYGEQVLPKL